jgi:hypothetical protein
MHVLHEYTCEGKIIHMCKHAKERMKITCVCMCYMDNIYWYIYVCMCVCIYVYISLYVCAYIHIYIYMHMPGYIASMRANSINSTNETKNCFQYTHTHIYGYKASP